MFKASILLSALVASTSAFATLLPDTAASYSINADKEDYRLGDEWGKKRVTNLSILKESAAFARAASSTAYLSVGGTGFYLGKFAGAHVLATNHHVCPVASDCVGGKADFRILGKKLKVKKLYITLPDVDLSLLEIEVPAKDEVALAKVAKNFSFKKDIKKGQELITIGFGVGGNENNSLMANKDSDCKVFSQTAEYVHLADPDDFNPASYSAWSFAHACDISHGDSGSAMVDRQTSEVVGIVWTGKIPKAKKIQSSAYLNKIFAEKNSPDVWKELSYAVPAVKIGEFLAKSIKSNEIDEETITVFKSLIK